MRLKLRTQNIEKLKDTLSLISHLRKFIVLRFTESQLAVILMNSNPVNQEPQIWCKLRMASLFDEIEVISNHDNTVPLELNIDLLLQTLRNFDKANSDGLNIRLQRKDTSGSLGGILNTGRLASLALFYSNTNANNNIVNHTFKIPVRILKVTHESISLSEPELSRIDLMIGIPNQFVSTYKRLDKFKKASSNDLVTLKASRRSLGFLGFVLEEEGKFKITISWNDKLEVQKPLQNHAIDGESMRTAVLETSNKDQIDENDENEDKEISVKLQDWRNASKIVATCKTVVLLIAHKEACALHCFLDDSEDVEIIYFISGVKIRDLLD